MVMLHKLLSLTHVEMNENCILSVAKRCITVRTRNLFCRKVAVNWRLVIGTSQMVMEQKRRCMAMQLLVDFPQWYLVLDMTMSVVPVSQLLQELWKDIILSNSFQIRKEKQTLKLPRCILKHLHLKWPQKDNEDVVKILNLALTPNRINIPIKA